MLMNDEFFCYALLERIKLDTAMRLSVESIARNSSAERKLTVHGVEDAILRLKTDDKKESTTNHCEEEEKQEEVNWMRNHSRGGRRPWNPRNRGLSRGNMSNNFN